MKKKNVVIISLIFVFVLIILLIFIFVKNLNKDKKLQEENIIIISNSYENMKKEVENYNNIRKDVSKFINNFYYDTISNEYDNNLEVLNNYDLIIGKITNEVKLLDEKCNFIYKDEKINNICNSYKNDYEVIVNVFMNDINNYNNKLKLFNKDNDENLELFKSINVSDYIDYNKDNIYLKKDEVNE